MWSMVTSEMETKSKRAKRRFKPLVFNSYVFIVFVCIQRRLRNSTTF